MTFHTAVASLTVYPLEDARARLAPLSADDVQPVGDGFPIHLQGDGQNFSPWYELVAGQ